MPWKEASGGYAESFSPAGKKVAFNNYHHLWILVVIWCYDWHGDAAVSTASLAVKRLCVQFQLDGFYVLLVSVGLGGGGFSRYSWLRIQDNNQEPDHQYWQPNPNLLKRDKKKQDLKSCIRGRRTKVYVSAAISCHFKGCFRVYESSSHPQQMYSSLSVYYFPAKKEEKSRLERWYVRNCFFILCLCQEMLILLNHEDFLKSLESSLHCWHCLWQSEEVECAFMSKFSQKENDKLPNRCQSTAWIKCDCKWVVLNVIQGFKPSWFLLKVLELKKQKI